MQARYRTFSRPQSFLEPCLPSNDGLYLNQWAWVLSLSTLTHPNHTHDFSPSLSCSAKYCGILPSSRSPTLGNSFHFTFQMNSKSYHFSSHPPILLKSWLSTIQWFPFLYHTYKVLSPATWPFVLWALPISHLNLSFLPLLWWSRWPLCCSFRLLMSSPQGMLFPNAPSLP